MVSKFLDFFDGCNFSVKLIGVVSYRKAEPGLQMVSEDEMYKDHNVAKARLVLALGELQKSAKVK